MCEFEFPAYFAFFLKRQTINLISANAEVEAVLRIVFQVSPDTQMKRQSQTNRQASSWIDRQIEALRATEGHRQQAREGGQAVSESFLVESCQACLKSMKRSGFIGVCGSENEKKTGEREIGSGETSGHAIIMNTTSQTTHDPKELAKERVRGERNRSSHVLVAKTFIQVVGFHSSNQAYILLLA